MENYENFDKILRSYADKLVKERGDIGKSDADKEEVKKIIYDWCKDKVREEIIESERKSLKKEIKADFLKKMEKQMRKIQLESFRKILLETMFLGVVTGCLANQFTEIISAVKRISGFSLLATILIVLIFSIILGLVVFFIYSEKCYNIFIKKDLDKIEKIDW